jgi:hypothetical protein
MGYKPKRKVYKLSFEGLSDFDGLVIRAYSTSLGNLLSVLGLTTIDTDNLSPKDVERLEELFKTFSDSLIEWNVEDDQDQPVPTTFEGVKSQDTDFILAIVRTWAEAIYGVSSPLGVGSSNGGQSPVPPGLTEASSPNPTSL